MGNEMQDALQAIEKLLSEQLARAEALRHAPSPRVYDADTPVVIGILPGDGIGPYIVPQAKRVLTALLSEQLHSGSIRLRDIDGLTLENRIARGCSVPPEVLAQIKNCDVLLKGPTTTPKGGTLESANVTLRRELDLYANVRPVSVPELGIDWVFFRENTEGEYVLGSRGIELPGMLSMDFKVTTQAGTERIARTAFEYARANKKTHVSIVTKANIMKKTDGNFSAICHSVAREYPEITAEDWYVDIMAANLINPALQQKFQVFLLPNLYGDILTDEAAQLQGGVGTAGSANIGGAYAMFEAIHGSAPRLVEEGLADRASPESILRAACLLLRHIGRSGAAGRLEQALDRCPVHADGTRAGASAAAYTDAVLSLL